MAILIHPSAIIETGASIGEGTRVGPFSVIGSNVEIGECSDIGSHCEIGISTGVLPESRVCIGAGSIVRSGSIIYQGVRLGPNLRTGHRVTIREATVAGHSFQIGTLCDVQGHCVIGDYVRLHSNVHVGQHSSIGDFVWIFPYVVLTNDPHPPSNVQAGCIIENFAVLATMSTILPGRRVGSDALVGAMTLVREDVPDHAICLGNPGRNVGETSKIRFKSTGKLVYPWRRHYHKGYPADIVNEWKVEFPDQ